MKLELNNYIARRVPTGIWLDAGLGGDLHDVSLNHEGGHFLKCLHLIVASDQPGQMCRPGITRTSDAPSREEVGIACLSRSTRLPNQ